MHGPAVVGWLLTILMGATGLYCLARLLRRRAPGAERQLDASEALKGLGMAAMALPYGLGPAVPVVAWVALFGAAGLWSVVAGVRPPNGTAQARGPQPEGSHRGHHLYHAVGHLAMVYMALAMAAPHPTGMAGMPGASGMARSGGLPVLTGALLLFFGGCALAGGLRLAGGGPGPVGPAAGTVAGRLLAAPRLPQACRMTLGLGMFTMLLAM